MNKEKKRVIEFFKAAFCVDGKGKIIKNEGFEIDGGVVELNDSKRGKFYVARVKKKTKQLLK